MFMILDDKITLISILGGTKIIKKRILRIDYVYGKRTLARDLKWIS